MTLPRLGLVTALAGYIEGQNLVIERRYSRGEPERLDEGRFPKRVENPNAFSGRGDLTSA
jgi:hypothetical protein